MTSNILDNINKIINSPGENADKSNKIMECLRGETIFLPASYRKQKETDQFCTVDPQKCLPLHLSQLEEGTGDQCVLDMIKRGVISIKGNSFGPFFPKAFFNEETYKVLSLLKESYIEGSSFTAGDRGAHNQATVQPSAIAGKP